jgi:hypothetical protein
MARRLQLEVVGMNQRGTAVIVPILGLMFAILIGFVGVVFVEQGRFAYATKITEEQVAARIHERLAVQVTRNPDNTEMCLVNQGSYPSVILQVLERHQDNSLGFEDRGCPICVGVLENRQVLLPGSISEDTKLGVLTSLGNAFWEESS